MSATAVTAAGGPTSSGWWSFTTATTTCSSARTARPGCSASPSATWIVRPTPPSGGREQAERTARYAAQREAERAEALAAGFRADLDGINAYVLARACVRFASDPQMTASRRAGLPERDRAAFDRYLADARRDRAHARGEGGHER
jgi:hypothetical protein